MRNLDNPMNPNSFDKVFTPLMLGGIGGIGGYVLVSTLLGAGIGFVAVVLTSVVYRLFTPAS